MEMLDLTEMERCSERLREAITARQSDSESMILRDSLVQRFEFTYEIATKLIRKAVHTTLAISEDPAERRSVPAAVRLAWEHGLLPNSWNVWDKFRDARNRTSHAYSEQFADELIALAPLLLNEVEWLLRKIKEHQSHA